MRASVRDFERLGGVGILTDADLVQLKSAVGRVYLLMRGGAWYGREAIELAAGTGGQPAQEGLRRMRELRQFFRVERRRVAERRVWEYRLILNKPVQITLFAEGGK